MQKDIKNDTNDMHYTKLIDKRLTPYCKVQNKLLTKYLGDKELF